MIVTEEYYTETYIGEPVNTAGFPRFNKRAEDIVNHITHGRLKDFDTFSTEVQTSVQNAICAQIEFYALNGIEVSILGDSTQGFTVGKVNVQKGNTKALTAAQSMIAPMCFAYLECTGLLNPQVQTLDKPYMCGGGYVSC